jgi:hypothetical protein
MSPESDWCKGNTRSILVDRDHWDKLVSEYYRVTLLMVISTKFHTNSFVIRKWTMRNGPEWDGGFMTRSLSSQKYTHIYKVVQIWPGQTVTCLHTNSPGHIWTTLYMHTYTHTHTCGGVLMWFIPSSNRFFFFFFFIFFFFFFFFLVFFFFSFFSSMAR